MKILFTILSFFMLSFSFVSRGVAPIAVYDASDCYHVELDVPKPGKVRSFFNNISQKTAFVFAYIVLKAEGAVEAVKNFSSAVFDRCKRFFYAASYKAHQVVD